MRAPRLLKFLSVLIIITRVCAVVKGRELQLCSYSEGGGGSLRLLCRVSLQNVLQENHGTFSETIPVTGKSAGNFFGRIDLKQSLFPVSDGM